MIYLPKAIYKFNAITFKAPSHASWGRRNYSKILVEPQKTLYNQNKKNNEGLQFKILRYITTLGNKILW